MKNGPRISGQRDGEPEANSRIGLPVLDRAGPRLALKYDLLITFRPMADVDPVRALRKLLKYAGRQCGLRCLHVAEKRS